MSPYLPFPDNQEMADRLVPIKESAKAMGCADTTLRNNAKARRLPAYQSRHGAPVYVLPIEVDEFLKSRPDIRSKHHPDSTSTDVEESRDEVAPVTCLPRHGLPLSSLDSASPEEVELVSRCLAEIAKKLRKLPQPEDKPELVSP